MAQKYTVCDGKLVLTLEEAEEGGFVVTSPMEPALVTEAETLSEAFMMARDAMKAIRQSRLKLVKTGYSVLSPSAPKIRPPSLNSPPRRVKRSAAPDSSSRGSGSGAALHLPRREGKSRSK